ncbi:unnamed protein product (macronuclear) [Paramecium tetraurelia]|uniref:Uncharacterized protein n=1 Tax=Paramecium tetraurelia TaxID=5888 RepID=A0D0D4_PARTE|nr:uncharacterized protein GSPATT00012053001 [Paramecium tetraurelia]CAK76501.1 unnamed protein product [Paramecium tetraurelia]|eukprot:XP_001443898.1 hypothetical protein (macronuclear) [Paramecium tetraurelia strain d4-2]
MNRNEDETTKLLQEIRNEVTDFTTTNFFGQVVQKYQSYEQQCFQENKANSIEFVKCMMKFQKRQIKEEKKMEFKIDYLKYEIAECLNTNERTQCQQLAINNIMQIQQEYLKSIELTLKQ